MRRGQVFRKCPGHRSQALSGLAPAEPLISSARPHSLRLGFKISNPFSDVTQDALQTFRLGFQSAKFLLSHGLSKYLSYIWNGFTAKERPAGTAARSEAVSRPTAAPSKAPAETGIRITRIRLHSARPESTSYSGTVS